MEDCGSSDRTMPAHSEKQGERHSGKQDGKQAERHSGKQDGKQAERHFGKQNGKQDGKHSGKQGVKRDERQGGKQGGAASSERHREEEAWVGGGCGSRISKGAPEARPCKTDELEDCGGRESEDASEVRTGSTCARPRCGGRVAKDASEEFMRRLEAVCAGEVLRDEPLSEHTTFCIGGPARWLVQPESADEVRRVIAVCDEAGIPWRVLGLGSNILAADEGLDEAVIKLAKNFAALGRYGDDGACDFTVSTAADCPGRKEGAKGVQGADSAESAGDAESACNAESASDAESVCDMESTGDAKSAGDAGCSDGAESAGNAKCPVCEGRLVLADAEDLWGAPFEPALKAAADGAVAAGDGILVVQAGASNEDVAAFALRDGLAGYEFASGIPGTVGGAAVMNAGAYDGEFKDVALAVSCLTPEGQVVTVMADDARWGYRKSLMMDKGYVVLAALLRLRPDDRAAIKARMDDLRERRTSKQPLEMPSAGSTFKRPEGYFAGKLIQDAGMQGHTVGGAQVSTKHAGFVVNAGGATAADVLELIGHVQDAVEADAGVRLEPEVRLWGFSR